MNKEPTYLILSLKWSGSQTSDKYATWYRPDSKGYCWSIDHAGLYTKEDAESRGDGTVAVPRTDAISMSVCDDFDLHPARYLPLDAIDALIAKHLTMKTYEDLTGSLFDRLTNNSNDVDKYASKIYEDLATRLLDNGNFHGFSHLWATDAFAFTFNETRIHHSLYDEYFMKMFGEEVHNPI